MACSIPTTTPITCTASTICAKWPSTGVAAWMFISTRPPASCSVRVSPIVSTSPAGSDYPPILRGHEIVAGETVKIGGAGGAIEALPFRQIHGSGETLGFRFGGLAYSPDVSDFPEESLKALHDLDVWIIDALRPAPHPSHFSVEQALAWIARVKPKRAVLTHMHVDLDYATLSRELPQGVEPAYDGMVLTTER